MKKLSLFLVIATLNSCDYVQEGQTIKEIESNGAICYYHTSNMLFSDFILAPCNLYKVGDTLHLK